MKLRKRIVSVALSALMCMPIASGALGGCAKGGGNMTDNGTGFAGIEQTKLTDSYGANALSKEVDYLLSLNEDKLLADFHNNADLTTSASAYGGGWEGALIGGHTLGHYLSALAQAYANLGTDSSKRQQIRSRMESIVKVLEKCQNNAVASGAKEGFLWGARAMSNPEQQFDNVEAGRGGENIGSVAWVPWYTMHKILAGLIDVYNFTGNETAKSVASKLGDWVYNRVSKWSEQTRAVVLAIEYGGMNDSLYNLYRITGNENHAIAAHKFDEDIAVPGRTTSLFTDILSEKENYLDNRHANTTIPKIIGALNRYMTLKATMSETEASEYLAIAEKFWTRVVEHHTYITGANSEWEHFGRDDILDAERTNANCETCNVYNMLKLSRMLFEITKDKKYLDFYEQAYINDILSSQNPETGMTTYFQAMATGYFKVYSTPESNFWCCTGSGMESMTKLGDSIYYLDGKNTYVSLYFSSELTAGDLKLTQTADLENSDVVTFEVTAGATNLMLRVPDWTASFSVMVGGKAVDDDISDGFFSVKVKKGDEVTVTMEKTLTAHGLPDNNKVYAFKYGPYVLSAELGTENMTTTTTGVNVTIPAQKNLGGFSETVKITSGSTSEFMNNLAEHLVRGENGKFTLTGTDQNLTYSIHYRQYTQRYGLYFSFLGNGEEIEDDSAYTFEPVDTVQPGYGQYENDDWHQMQDSGSVGSTNDSAAATSRLATANGSFTYQMAVEKGETNYLIVRFVTEDAGKSILIKSGDTELYKKTLAYDGPSALYEILIELPESVVNGATAKTVNGETRDLIPITISGINGEESARVGNFLYTARVTFKETNFTGERDSNIAYFVDCGDYDPTTVSAGDKFGTYNSVTEQLFGVDYATGRYWGLVDGADPLTGTAGSTCTAGGISTANTWPNEQIVGGDGVAKTVSNRYTKNQWENGKDRYLCYLFDLDDGDYEIEVYFLDPWNCSKNVCVTANGEQIITNAAIGRALTATVHVSGGFLKLEFTTQDLCINLAYIKISF